MVTGVSFSPLSQPTSAGGSAPASPTNAVQDAIRLLSLKLPTLGPTAPSGVLGGPTALGPALGGSFGQQLAGRQKVMPVPTVNAGQPPGGDVLSQLLQALGIPALGGSGAPAKVQFHGPPDALPGLGQPQPASMADLLSNVMNQSSEGPGGWFGAGNSLTPMASQPGAQRTMGPALSPFRTGSPEYQQPF